MIKMNTEIIDGHISGNVIIKGDMITCAYELANALNQIAEHDEKLVSAALDKYLDLRGFPEVTNAAEG